MKVLQGTLNSILLTPWVAISHTQNFMTFAPQVPIWCTGCVKIYSNSGRTHNNFCQQPRFIRGFSTDFSFPIAVMSYGYQIMSTSVKLNRLKRHFYDLSENVHVHSLSEKAYGIWSFFKDTHFQGKWCGMSKRTQWSSSNIFLRCISILSH